MANLRPTTRVARGATWLFAQGFANALIGLVYFVILAHTFSGVEQWQMGVFALLSFILTLIPVFGTLAFPSAATKYIAQHLAEGNPGKARSVIARVLQTAILMSVVSFSLLFLPAEWLSSLMFGNADFALLLRIIAVCSIFAILNAEAVGFLQGMQRMREVALVGVAYSIISASIGIFLLPNWGLYAVASGWLVGQLVASLAGLALTAKYIGVSGKPYPLRPLLNFSLPLYISTSIYFLVGWVDQLLLVSYIGLLYGALEAQRVLGIYYVAVRASTVPTLFSSAAVTALFPQLSQLYTQQGASSLKDAFRVSTRYSVLIGFPLIVGLATLAYPVIILFTGGREYVEATVPLIIISIGALVGTLGTAVGPILMTLEKTKIVSALSVLQVVLSFVLSYLGLAYLNLGMIGTAWARTLAAIVGLALSIYILTHYVLVSFDKEATWKASMASAFMVLAIFGLDIARKFFSTGSYEFLVIRLHLLPIYVLAGGIAYFLSLIALGAIKKHDVELMAEYVPGSLKRAVTWLGRFAATD